MDTSRSSSTFLDRRAFGLVLAAFVCGCSGNSGGGPDASVEASFGAEPITTVTSDDGALSISVRTAPQPPVRGVNRVRLDVTAADGGMVASGLGVAVQPWMPAMGHGPSVQPTVTGDGGSQFEASNVVLNMPGTWELRLSFSGPVQSHATANVDIP